MIIFFLKRANEFHVEIRKLHNVIYMLALPQPHPMLFTKQYTVTRTIHGSTILSNQNKYGVTDFMIKLQLVFSTPSGNTVMKHLDISPIEVSNIAQAVSAYKKR